MVDTLLIQSFKNGPQPAWIELCLKSAQDLADLQGWDYRFIGDELFEPLPHQFIAKVGHRGPILSDLGRLIACKKALEEYEKVLWLDADTLIFNPQAFRLPKGSFGFGRERWIQPKSKLKPNAHTKLKKKDWKIYRSICNALCYFERQNPFLDFYMYTCESIIDRVDPEHIAPQIIGPKLLSALHNIIACPFTTAIGSASPHLIMDVSRGYGQALELHRNDLSVEEPEAGLNLCHSLLNTECYQGELMTSEHLLRAIQNLTSQGQV